jgi:hypothetical protein
MRYLLSMTSAATLGHPGEVDGRFVGLDFELNSPGAIVLQRDGTIDEVIGHVKERWHELDLGVNDFVLVCGQARCPSLPGCLRAIEALKRGNPRLFPWRERPDRLEAALAFFEHRGRRLGATAAELQAHLGDLGYPDAARSLASRGAALISQLVNAGQLDATEARRPTSGRAPATVYAYCRA